jgi:hypothetical protein
MKIWRGIFTKKSRIDVISMGFDHLPADRNHHLSLILDKVLDNFSEDLDTRKLTSFSKSKQIALRHSGPEGWLIQLEVEHKDLLDSEPFLESARNHMKPGSREWERISEAIEMTHADKEVFLTTSAKYRIVEVLMVGSWKPI